MKTEVSPYLDNRPGKMTEASSLLRNIRNRLRGKKNNENDVELTSRYRSWVSPYNVKMPEPSYADSRCKTRPTTE